MKITRLDLQNYRRFEDFSIDFDPELTVIVARNGQGKTTVLEAVVAALGPFVGAFDEGRGQHLLRTDAHRKTNSSQWPSNEPQYPVVVEANLSRNGDSDLAWSRRLNSGKKGAKTTVKEATPLTQWGKELQERVRRGENVDLPVVGYYSSKRLWLSHKNYGSRNSAILTKSRTAAYDEALSTMVSSFGQIEQWMKLTFLSSWQRMAKEETPNNFADWLVGVSSSVNHIMVAESWANFQYDFALDELSMDHPDHGVLPVSMLSDGVRAVISLVADLALRCVRLNPHLGWRAPLETTGIVLIDEVDLHLHPAWQQSIVSSLKSTFPLVQFVLTTHSPQVVSTVSRKHIRIVSADEAGRWSATIPDEEVKGLASSIALREVMNVSAIPAVDEAERLRSYTELIETGKADSAKGQELRTELERFYGLQHSVILDAERLIRFQSFKSRIRPQSQPTDHS